MEEHPRPIARAGGFLLAVAIIAGAVAGTISGQPSIGVIGGVAVGALIAILIWLADRRRF